ncbi:MAG: beta-ketoacyl-ACP synthase, partial [Victivallales bacterium]|nr:beta-ketoacyl-ACP synthase [Victivallales bacterium]
FNALGVCSPEPCKPFDANRKGLNLGEAAGVVIMTKCPETYSPFSVIGFGKRADAFHITQPKPEGEDLENAIKQALAKANLSPSDIAFINAHGTGTQANDSVEATVFARLFNGNIPFMSTKALTGHTLGAAGAIEAIFTLIMLERQIAVKSTRFETKPDDFPIAPLRENLPLRNAQFALSTSLAFGGSNTALVLQYQP